MTGPSDHARERTVSRTTTPSATARGPTEDDSRRNLHHSLGRGELVGAFATDVQTRLCARLEEHRPEFAWETERRIAGTPVDVAGVGSDRLVCCELEWRRADPADNTAKLFRHLAEGTIDEECVDVVQAFTGYYDLASGGVSSKRENAEFVGRVAADALAALSYSPVEFGLDPPKRGGERSAEWRTIVDDTAERIAATLPK